MPEPRAAQSPADPPLRSTALASSPERSHAAPAVDPGPPDPYRDPFCPKCGYCLRGLPGTRCPECGANVEAALAGVAAIPWVHRQRIGRLRAFWTTVWRATFQPRQFCQEISRPISHRDAVRFRLAVAAHAYLLVIVGTALAMFEDWNGFVSTASALGWWFAAVVYAALFLALLAMSGMHTYFFHPRTLPIIQQNRALALSHYAAAPMVFLPLGLVLAFACLRPSPRSDMLASALMILGGGVIGFVLVLWIVTPARFAHFTLHPVRRPLRIALLAPLFGLLAGCLIAIGLPAIILYVAIIIVSLQ